MSNDELRTNARNSRKYGPGYSFHDFGFLRHSSLVLGHFSGVSEYFFNGGVARKDAAQAVLAQRDHPKLDRLLFYRNCGRALIDQLTEGICNFQKLVNPFPSFVAGVVTSVAALSVEELFAANVLPRKAQFS